MMLTSVTSSSPTVTSLWWWDVFCRWPIEGTVETLEGKKRFFLSFPYYNCRTTRLCFIKHLQISKCGASALWLHVIWWFFICSTAGKRQRTAARVAWVPSSQSETEKNHRIGFRRVKRMLNSLQYGPRKMFRSKTNGSVNVSVLALLLYAAHICQEHKEFKNTSVSGFIIFNFQKHLCVIDLLSELKMSGSELLWWLTVWRHKSYYRKFFFLYGSICFCKIEIKMRIV